MAKVTAAELAQDVDAAEKLISRHEEHRAEINSRQDTLKRFYATGNDLIRKVRLNFLENSLRVKTFLNDRNVQFCFLSVFNHLLFRDFHIFQGHFLGNDIQEKIRILEQRYYLLNETWNNRRILYEQNLDTEVCLFLKQRFQEMLIKLNNQTPCLLEIMLPYFRNKAQFTVSNLMKD